MRRGDPDTGRGVHRLEQVSREIAQRAVKYGDGLRRERKPGVGVADNRTDRHDLLSYQAEFPRQRLVHAIESVAAVTSDGHTMNRVTLVTPTVRRLAAK
jgi:hypothetical protein